jgi:tRNA(Ile)-lysidine synthase
LEADARRERYARLARHVGPGEVLLTAHHRDDQAETLLLQLLRGAGLPGLAAMPAIQEFSAGRHARPLLEFSRRDLDAYAIREKLSWIEDASNRDTRWPRNFLRERVLPLVMERWPAAPRLLGRTARHTVDALALLDEIADADLGCCRKENAAALSIAALQRLTAPRQRNVLRYWIRVRGFPAASALQLEHVRAQVRASPRTRRALVTWPGTEVRRYRDTLVVRTPVGAPDKNLSLAWNLPAPLVLPGTGRQLRAVPATGAGLSQNRVAGAVLTVRFRRGGESCLLPGRAHHHSLKKLLQEAGVPPWERERLPLVFVNGALAAVGDRWVCAPFAARPDEAGWTLVLEEARAARGNEEEK